MNSPDRASPRGSITIADVSAAAGVSLRTVSRVLNRSPKVGPATRETVERVIAELGFRPSLRARALASGRSFLIGVVQSDPNAHVIGRFQRGIVEVAAQHGYELIVHPAAIDDPGLVDNVRDFVGRSRVVGLVLLPPVSEIMAVVEALAVLDVPAVGIAAVRVPGYPAMLVSDEYEAARTVARHFMGHRHRRIATITGPLRFHSAIERLRGFRDQLAEYGEALPEAYVREGDYSFESGLAAADALLSLPEPPTAIFAANDIMAAGLLKAATARGIAVPRDLSIAGFDDADIASMLSPSLTTIRRPLLDMARDATERLMALIGGADPDATGDRHVALELVTRQSSAMTRDRQPPSL